MKLGDGLTRPSAEENLYPKFTESSSADVMYPWSCLHF